MSTIVFRAALIFLTPGIVNAAVVYGTIEGDFRPGGEVTVQCSEDELFIGEIDRYGSYEVYVDAEDIVFCMFSHNDAGTEIEIAPGANEYYFYHDGEELLEN